MKIPFHRWLRRLRAIASALAAALPALAFAAPPPGILDDTHAAVQAVMAVQGEVTPTLMAEVGVLGTAVGLSDNGDVSLMILVDRENPGRDELVRSLPPALRGVAVQVELTDRIVALAGKPGGGGGVSHTAKQTLPIQLGTSGGWRHDLANGYCCAGTLGSLVQVNGVQYILSNYHVLEADIVSGGNNRVAYTGDPVIQPGLIDVGCNAGNAQDVATLRKISSLPASNVDVAIAQVNQGTVRADGAILEIGTISSQTVAAFINQAVKKSGRTTKLTRSAVSGLNATISVAYDNECAGGAAFTKTFTGQILIKNRRSAFLDGGDSGALMVEDVASNPKAVGLLYAGSSTIAVANPIDQVLTFVGSQLGGTAAMVGN